MSRAGAPSASQEEIHRLLTQLVALDTTSARSNLPLLEVVSDLLAAHGVEHAVVPDATGTWGNLIARIGPPVPGGVVLNAHTDCVPVDGQPWSRDPFRLHAADGRLYGRGTADMKGFLAVVLALLEEAVAAPLTRPLLLVLTHSEELGTLGAPDAVASLLASQPRPAAVIVGEPTEMRPVTAHKGVRVIRTIVDGLDAHSSQPHRAANAVAALARIATAIDELAAEYRAGPLDARFDPPYTTFNLARVEGGSAANIVPRRAELLWEYRPVPADDSAATLDRVEAFARAEVLPRLRAATGTGAVRFEVEALARGLDAGADGAAEHLIRALTGDDRPAGTVAFATDGGHFQAAGLSTVVCGPGSIDQAHQADEWILTSELVRCTALLRSLIAHLTR